MVKIETMLFQSWIVLIFLWGKGSADQHLRSRHYHHQVSGVDVSSSARPDDRFLTDVSRDDEYVIVSADNESSNTMLWQVLRRTVRVVQRLQDSHPQIIVVRRLSKPLQRILQASRYVDSIEPNDAAWFVLDERDNNASSTTSWGLERIGHHHRPLLVDPSSAGTGVQVYIIDSGLQVNHSDFDGRARCGYNAFAAVPTALMDSNDTTTLNCEDDSTGHGTHVAGIVGGTTWGVAPGVEIVAVKSIHNGIGSLSSVLGGVLYACQQKIDHPERPVVVNMSVSGRGRSQALDRAVAACHAAGVVFVASAGNLGRDACAYSPAALAETLAVGAVDVYDRLPFFSNHGPCVDLYAPGLHIPSLGTRNDAQVVYKSGTSMAAPFVSGAAALYLERNPDWNGTSIVDALLRDAEVDSISGLSDTSNNYLLQLAPDFAVDEYLLSNDP